MKLPTIFKPRAAAAGNTDLAPLFAELVPKDLPRQQQFDRQAAEQRLEVTAAALRSAEADFTTAERAGKHIEGTPGTSFALAATGVHPTLFWKPPT